MSHVTYHILVDPKFQEEGKASKYWGVGAGGKILGGPNFKGGPKEKLSRIDLNFWGASETLMDTTCFFTWKPMKVVGGLNV